MRIRTRILLVISTAVIVTAVTFSCIVYLTQRRLLLKDVDTRLVEAARLARAKLPSDYHDRIDNTDSVSEDEYLAIVKGYNSLCRQLGIQYIWSLALLNGQIVFTSATSTTRDLGTGEHAAFLEPHSNPEAYTQAFSTMRTQYATFHDKWGEGRMVLVPDRDRRGRPFLFAASVDLGDVRTILGETLMNSTLVGLSMLLVGMIAALIVAGSISQPISEIADVARGIAAGDLNPTVQGRGGYELESLAASINAMGCAIREKIAELEKSREDLQFQAGLLDQIGDMITATDLAGRITYVNEAEVRRLGMPREALIGQNVQIFGEDAARGATQQEIVERTLENGSWQGEVVNFAQDGTEMILHARTWVLRDEAGKALGLCGASTDITERKQAEREHREMEEQMRHVQKLESLGVLAGGIAHDFNNLLTAILGNADLALTDLSPMSPARTSLMEIVKASRHAAELCRQMLAYSGRGRFVIARVDLPELVREMVHILEVSITKKATLQYDFADDTPRIEADAAQIRQVIMNLITNASEALKDGEGTILVRTGGMHCDRVCLGEGRLDGRLPEGQYAFIEVEDTGCGMDEETQRRLFDPFFTTKFTGRGLGLSAVLGIVRGHRGTIKVESEAGKGTTFRVLFPISEDQSPVEGHQLLVDTGTMRVHGATILIVDDEEYVRDVGKNILERAGFTVLLAVDGREAVDQVRQHGDDIRCIFLDLTMPHMDGQQAFGEIRKIRADIPIIIMSGYSGQDVAGRFRGKDVASFIQKPYRSGTLLAALQEALSRHAGPA